MRRLHKWISLSGPERRLCAEAFFLLWSIRLALWTFPYRTVHQFVARCCRKKRVNLRPDIPPPTVGDLTTKLARLVPGASCLTQALTAQILLARRGKDSSLRFGGKTVAGKFEAHAWVEAGSEIIVGKAVWREFSDFQSSTTSRSPHKLFTKHPNDGLSLKDNSGKPTHGSGGRPD